MWSSLEQQNSRSFNRQTTRISRSFNNQNIYIEKYMKVVTDRKFETKIRKVPIDRHVSMKTRTCATAWQHSSVSLTIARRKTVSVCVCVCVGGGGGGLGGGRCVCVCALRVCVCVCVRAYVCLSVCVCVYVCGWVGGWGACVRACVRAYLGRCAYIWARGASSLEIRTGILSKSVTLWTPLHAILFRLCEHDYE